jgi:hypothetical protein
MSERIAACQELAGVVAELRALRDRWEASADTLLCLGAGRLEAPLELLRDIEEIMRRGTRLMGGRLTTLTLALPRLRSKTTISLSANWADDARGSR